MIPESRKTSLRVRQETLELKIEKEPSVPFGAWRKMQ